MMNIARPCHRESKGNEGQISVLFTRREGKVCIVSNGSMGDGGNFFGCDGSAPVNAIYKPCSLFSKTNACKHVSRGMKGNVP